MNRLTTSQHQRTAGAPLQTGGMLQRATQDREPETQISGGVPPIVQEVLRSSGQPLDTNTRAFMEPRFDHDFSRVRVHTDARAAESAQAVSAYAYTVGQHIAIGKTAFD